MSVFQKVFGMGIDKTIDSVKSLVTTFVTDKGALQHFNAELERQAHELKLKQIDFEQELLQAETNDRANARAMNIETMKNSDPVVRRFPVYIAFGIFFLSAICLVGLMFFPVPETNRDIVNISLGTLFGGGLSTIVNFYFGASYTRKND